MIKNVNLKKNVINLKFIFLNDKMAIILDWLKNFARIKLFLLRHFADSSISLRRKIIFNFTDFIMNVRMSRTLLSKIIIDTRHFSMTPYGSRTIALRRCIIPTSFFSLS